MVYKYQFDLYSNKIYFLNKNTGKYITLYYFEVVFKQN